MFECQLKITFLRLPVQQEFVSECPFPTVPMPFPHTVFCTAPGPPSALGGQHSLKGRLLKKNNNNKSFSTLLVPYILLRLTDLPSPKACNEYRIINFLMGFCMVLSLQHLNSLKTVMNSSSQHPFEVRGYFYHYFTQGEWNI